MSGWFTARELAGKPGMPGTERGARDRLDRLGVSSRSRVGRGGGKEYDGRQLPPETRRALLADKVAEASVALVDAPQPVQLPAPVAASVPTTTQRMPSDADKKIADARLALVNQVHEMEQIHGITRAVKVLSLQVAARECSASLLEAARQANQRSRDASVSERSLMSWLAQHRKRGWWGLLPTAAPAHPTEVSREVAAVIALYHTKDAQFRNLTDAAKEVARRLQLPADAWKSLYSRARRVLPKVDPVTLIKSRHSGSERTARLPFKRRDTTGLLPLDVWVIDGHTFKAKVRHPDHGSPFAPELTAVIDAATRKICGWSVALSENVIAVGDALRHAVSNDGIPALIYSDNGAGETAKQLDCPITGVIARLGSTHKTGLPGNPQARGIIERSWGTWAIPCARQFPTYQGSKVDAGTLRKVSAELAKEQRALRRAESTGEVIQLSTKAPSWQQFIDAVERAVHQYNTEHRHRSLPKHTSGPHAGKHMTPAEAWEAMLDRDRQFRLSELDLQMLFMPCLLRTARRGEVKFFNQVYSSPDLMAVEGKTVRVHYDIHDPSYVVVMTTASEYICKAEWNANQKDYFAKPVVQMAHEKRVATRMKLLQGQMDLAQRELTGKPVSALGRPQPAVVLAPEVTRVERASVTPDVDAAPAQERSGSAQRPFFETPSERYEWLMNNRARWEETDQEWISAYVTSEDYADLAEFFASRGIAWGEGDEELRGAR